MKVYTSILTTVLILTLLSCTTADSTENKESGADTQGEINLTYPIVDTGVSTYYSDTDIISTPSATDTFFGQDASYQGNNPSYIDNGDGTISDTVTGLTWEQSMGEKISWEEAFEKAKESRLGGYDDWRVPTLKELYSLIQFTGQVSGQKAGTFFIDTNYFEHPLGDTTLGEREIDAQTWSSTEYAGKTMNGDATVFGVNFVDGRIKGYPKYDARSGEAKLMYFRLVRGNIDYGINQFVDNGDGTISDLATGLMWQTRDDGVARDWEDSLSYAENLTLSDYDD